MTDEQRGVVFGIAFVFCMALAVCLDRPHEGISVYDAIAIYCGYKVVGLANRYLNSPSRPPV